MTVGLRNLLNFKKNDMLGLDIGCSSVKVIGLKKSDAGYEITAAGYADITSAGNTSGLIHKSGVLRAIRECLDQVKCKTKLAVCSLNGPEVVIRDFKFHGIPAEELEGAVELEASQMCPFGTENTTVDYQVLSSDEDEIHGILVATTNDLVNSRLQITKEANIECGMIDVDGLALLNCFTELEKPESDQTIVILNIGRTCATMAVMGPNKLPFVRDMTYAGNAIVAQIASDNNMPEQDVNRILSEGSPDERRQIHNSLEKSCAELVEEINTTSRFYKTQHKGTTFERIHLCGGFALIDGFIDLLNDQIASEVVLWNPFDKLGRDTAYEQHVKGDDILRTKGPLMSVAAGLALRSI